MEVPVPIPSNKDKTLTGLSGRTFFLASTPSSNATRHFFSTPENFFTCKNNQIFRIFRDNFSETEIPLQGHYGCSWKEFESQSIILCFCNVLQILKWIMITYDSGSCVGSWSRSCLLSSGEMDVEGVEGDLDEGWKKKKKK